jgi:hypothetical protein
LVFFSNDSFGQPLETLNASYASVTGSRIPLWIAKDAGLFERHGLQVNLVVIAAAVRPSGHSRVVTWKFSGAGFNDDGLRGERAAGGDHWNIWSWRLEISSPAEIWRGFSTSVH